MAAAIRELAGADREALGFLPEAAYDDAIRRRRVLAMIDDRATPPTLAGFVLFSGVLPNARVQQVVVHPDHRRRGVGTALLRALTAHLEAMGFVRLTAAVADDLGAAQAFYSRNGFSPMLRKPGGKARGRTIVVRARDLDNGHLFSVLDQATTAEFVPLDLGLRVRGARPAPLYAIDLNVLFDVTKPGREVRRHLAERVIGAALAHRFRLVVASEFLTELERTSSGRTDPILAMARHLPRLPAVDKNELELLAGSIKSIVFGSALTGAAARPQATSDARHLAHAALARASGFLTSDGPILDARASLIATVGIDALSLDDFEELLDQGHEGGSKAEVIVAGEIEIGPCATDAAWEHLRSQGVSGSNLAQFNPGAAVASAARQEGVIVGLALRQRGPEVGAPAKLMVHVRPEHVRAELVAEALVNAQCLAACDEGPTAIELQDIRQAVVRRVALLQGFQPRRQEEAFVKVALGRPVTQCNWTAVARLALHRTELQLPAAPPRAGETMKIVKPDGSTVLIAPDRLEDALGPTLIAWEGRPAAIVPITQPYADDLLGTSLQRSLLGKPAAAVASRRTFVNTRRSAPALRPGTAMLFYESGRSGGRGAIVAVARVVDAIIAPKSGVPKALLQRAVVSDLRPLSATDEVLVTTFDHLMPVPAPIRLPRLRAMGAVGGNNLVTVTTVGSHVLEAILDEGWPSHV
ncbi:GNAT family N-acetyltransferase [Acidisphaera rubrifaciens]|uniref:N-acetyltransferase n=1 Tax=Acidisphaera rubrifaciens HS-AP3 TaxID=1231350 RepID=A0A0D6P694_9PROT|nr:GNAT family N-acetyltransferase [Acidisphaera rubrifaciens]GAN76718.1 N-acetyltransferase [Acidisphaera rubrifaciens HS-AP3]